MLDKIFIPTMNRIGKQYMYDSLPKKWKDISVLVVNLDEHEKHGEIPTLPVPDDIRGISKVREWIIKYAKANNIKKIAMLDDDLEFIRMKINPITNKAKAHTMTEEDWDDCLEMCSKELETLAFGTLSCTWSPPLYEYVGDVRYCGRINSNVFYNTEICPIDEIDWLGCEISEDYYVALQLLTKGYKNFILEKYRVNPKDNFGEGGCSSYRTIDLHNNCFLKLKELYPDYISLREKVQNSGLWKGQKRLAATIRWKKSYTDALKKMNKIDETLEKDQIDE